MAQAQNSNLRKTLIKHMIGKVRTSHYLLPEDHFVFGISNKLDREGAAQVISSWAPSVEPPSKPKSTRTNITATNHRDVIVRKNHLIKNHDPEICHNRRTNTPLVSKKLLKGGPWKKTKQTEMIPHDRVYGIKSYSNDISIKELLKRCSPDHMEEKDYPDRSNMKKKGQLPPAKSTKASRMYIASLESCGNKKVSDKPWFKMQKFLKIDSKVKHIFKH